MTKEEIEKYNPIIAKFMGVYPKTMFRNMDTGRLQVKESENTLLDLETIYIKNNTIVTDLKYHLDWNWIMPVVEKIEIECKYDVNIYGHYNWVAPFRCVILDNRNNEIVYQSNDSKLQCVYEAVCKFIEWYNEQVKE